MRICVPPVISPVSWDASAWISRTACVRLYGALSQSRYRDNLLGLRRPGSCFMHVIGRCILVNWYPVDVNAAVGNTDVGQRMHQRGNVRLLRIAKVAVQLRQTRVHQTVFGVRKGVGPRASGLLRGFGGEIGFQSVASQGRLDTQEALKRQTPARQMESWGARSAHRVKGYILSPQCN